MAALGAVFGRGARGTRRGRHVSGRRLAARIGPQRGYSFEEYPAMTDRTNADFLQVLLGQVREDPFVDLVVAESRLVFFEAQAPQPDHHIHQGAHNQGWRVSSAGEASVSRVALGF